MKFQYAILFFTSLMLFSCGESTENSEKSEQTDQKAERICSYEYNAEATSIEWTAYKTTEMIGVDGAFDEFMLSDTKTGNSAFEVFQDASFIIPIASLNTQNPDRDEKIKTFFFETVNTDSLSGKLVSFNEDGTATVEIEMNGVKQEVVAQIEETGNRLTLATKIDVSAWNASTGIDALNEVCYDLHKGADGISKLWPDVSIKISTVLDKACK